MDEYIKREAVINRIKEYASDVYGIDLDNSLQFAGITGNGVDEDICEGLHEAIELVNDIPAADVASVVHARWITRSDKGIISMTHPYMCSRCWRVEMNKEPYCNCGAKMDGVSENSLGRRISVPTVIERV